MDINSLLSPSDPPREKQPAPSTKPSPRKSRKPRASKNNATSSSPHSKSASSPPIPPYNAALQTQTPMTAISSPPMAHPTSHLRRNTTSTPPADAFRTARQPSTPGMDTLADLASMQHHQQTAREKAGGLRSTEIYDTQTTTNTVLPALHSLARPQGALRGSIDLTMADPPPQASPPKTYSANSLSEADLQRVTQLVEYLAANPLAYESHVQLIKLLHQGFRSHVSPASPSRPRGNPHTYDLGRDLQNAREAMSARFALGEDLWIDWIQDQQLLANSLEEKIAVMESCQKAVDEESGSVSLWLLYANWMLSLFKNANPNDRRILDLTDPPIEDPNWSEEDRVVAREVCSWQQMLDVWRQGVQETTWHMDDSHRVWDRYTELLLQDLAMTPVSEGIAAMQFHFKDRLDTPHATWDQTFQAFSTFMSQYDNAAYEDTMVQTTQHGGKVRDMYSAREIHEVDLKRARESGNRDTEWAAFTNYIEWEFAQSRKRNAFSFDLVNALYQRATLRFPTDTTLWEGYVMFLNDEITAHSRKEISPLPVLDQGTRHCPWAGMLWAQYLLVAEREDRPFSNMEQIKHKATSTGTLDAGGMEEVLKVHTAWCSFLRRRAFMAGSTDEDQDVAEVGIRSAIEDMNTLGCSKYGNDYQGDPSFRLERIYIKYLTQCRNWQGARETWKGLIPHRGDTSDFWLRYYLWEMSTWGKLAYSENEHNGAGSIKPSEATKVLRQALRRPKLDWPERLLEVFQFHCEDHEDAEEIQSAVVLIWKTKRNLQKRREKEAMESYQAAQAETAQQPTMPQDVSMESTVTHQSTKRKREEDDDALGEGGSKRNRPEKFDTGGNRDAQIPLAPPSALKRDRENATIVVKNLPNETSETRIRQYFRDCGTINSLKLLPDDNGESATATIEFESKEDILTAQTKDMKNLDGRDIHITVGTGNTLYVTNYPPAADEAWLRKQFERFGEVLDVRFPSLKFNAHRRFCYIQFRLPSQARAATQLDGQKLDGKLAISAKLSDPAHKQSRHGPMHEGRELYVANVDWTATMQEVKDAFSPFGVVENVRIPLKFGGQSKGIAFVVFEDKEAAKKALEMNLTRFKSRVISVTPSTNDTAKRQATTIINPATSCASYSPTPDPTNSNGVDAASAASPASQSSIPQPRTAPPNDRNSRTIALLNVPDTVTSDRIRVLAEAHGALVKVQLRPDHQGAIIEYVEAANAGKAGLALDGHEIAPGRKLRVGTVSELFKEKAEVRQSDKIAVGKKKKEEMSLPTAMPIRRPGQPGVRRGGRGGLGVKRGGVGLSGVRAKDDGVGKRDDGALDGEGEGGVRGRKSNADFKAMLSKG